MCPCRALLPEIGHWQREHAQSLTLALISRGSEEANRAKAAEHGIDLVLLQQDREVAEIYRSVPTPSAVLILPDGRIDAPAALGSEAIRQSVSRTAPTHAAPPTIPLRLVPANGTAPNRHGGAPNGKAAPGLALRPTRIGEVAPAVQLPDLDGTPVDLSSFRGEPVLVLFWNPGCGYCARMLDDLKAWEANPPPDAPRLVVISTGSVESNSAMGLLAPILLDQGFAVGRLFGASGTPSAVLLAADGTVASEVAVGDRAVLTLAGSPAPQSVAAREAWTVGPQVPKRSAPS